MPSNEFRDFYSENIWWFLRFFLPRSYDEFRDLFSTTIWWILLFFPREHLVSFVGFFPRDYFVNSVTFFAKSFVEFRDFLLTSFGEFRDSFPKIIWWISFFIFSRKIVWFAIFFYCKSHDFDCNIFYYNFNFSQLTEFTMFWYRLTCFENVFCRWYKILQCLSLYHPKHLCKVKSEVKSHFSLFFKSCLAVLGLFSGLHVFDHGSLAISFVNFSQFAKMQTPDRAILFR